jgi:hypothetical protein
MINQGTGASINQMGRTNFKNTITCGTLSQTSGSSVLKDTNIGVLTQGTNCYITQQGTSGVANNLRSTYITDLVVSNSISLPSNVVLPSTTYSGDIIMNDSRIVQNGTTGTKTNQFINTNFIGEHVYVDGNFTMTNNSKTSVLKNPTLDGDISIGGSISQSTGANSFGDSMFPQLICDNLIPLEINQYDPSNVYINELIDTNFTGDITQTSGSNTFQTSSFPSVTCSGNISTSTINTATVSNSQINALAGISTSSNIESRLSSLYYLH